MRRIGLLFVILSITAALCASSQLVVVPVQAQTSPAGDATAGSAAGSGAVEGGAGSGA